MKIIDFKYWTRKYEDDYPKDTEGSYPVFLAQNNVWCEEKSPYFTAMSKVIQKRGFLLKREFVSIGKWKTERQTSRYEENSTEHIEKTTQEAIRAPENRRIQILRKLKGVEVPVASAILTVIYPEEYCVIDYRAWRAILWLHTIVTKKCFAFTSYEAYSDFLDLYDSYGKISAYFSFLKTLRRMAAKRNMSPRQIEMALWKFDQLKGKAQVT